MAIQQSLRGLRFAAKKGMIVVVAAGNEGNKPWHFITTPADADSVILLELLMHQEMLETLAVTVQRAMAALNQMWYQWGLALLMSTTTGTVGSSNGTSFATPNMAGLITCLWQAFPEFTNMEIIQAVKKSSSTYKNPDDRLGYGIPEFSNSL